MALGLGAQAIAADKAAQAPPLPRRAHTCYRYAAGAGANPRAE
jgi:hypothetical protein